MATHFCKGLKPGLYAITDATLLPGERLMSGVRSALEGGAVLVQYRDKSGSPRERQARARDLSALCRDFGVPLIINDDPQLAAAVAAAGVHLGQSDTAPADARKQLGEHAIIGVTCHDRLDLARQAREDGADYIAFGRFFVSGTKPGAPSATPDILTRASNLGLPTTAIGGITLDNGADIIRAGADLLAVVGGLFAGDPDQIRRRAQAFTQLFAKHHPLFSSFHTD